MSELHTCEHCGRSRMLSIVKFRCNCQSAKQKQIAFSERRPKCKHRGSVLRDVPCGCAGKPKIFECVIHGECIVKKLAHEAAKPFKCCQECTEWE